MKTVKRNPMRLVAAFMTIAFGLGGRVGQPAAPRARRTNTSAREIARHKKQNLRNVTVNGFSLMQTGR